MTATATATAAETATLVLALQDYLSGSTHTLAEDIDLTNNSWGADSVESRLLSSAVEATLEAISYHLERDGGEGDNSDRLRDAASAVADEDGTIADAVLPTYTDEVWAAFVGLGGYHYDLSAIGIGGDVHLTGDLTESLARPVLWDIARRVVEHTLGQVDSYADTLDA